MSEPASIASGIAERYASAVFDLARESGAVDALSADVAALSAALKDSADLRSMIASPIVSRHDQERAISALAVKMGLSDLMQRALKLMAEKRRLFVLPQLAAQLETMIADARGEMTAEVTSAKALTDTQAKKLAEALSAKVGKTVKLKTAVEPALIGGLVVKVGSTMIDSSIRSKLDALQNAMKEVG